MDQRPFALFQSNGLSLDMSSGLLRPAVYVAGQEQARPLDVVQDAERRWMRQRSNLVDVRLPRVDERVHHGRPRGADHAELIEPVLPEHDRGPLGGLGVGPEVVQPLASRRVRPTCRRVARPGSCAPKSGSTTSRVLSPRVALPSASQYSNGGFEPGTSRAG